MTAEAPQNDLAETSDMSFSHEPPPVQRTAEEKARILAHLTSALAAFNDEEGPDDGNA